MDSNLRFLYKKYLTSPGDSEIASELINQLLRIVDIDINHMSDVFIVRHETQFRKKNLAIFSTLDAAKDFLEKEIPKLTDQNCQISIISKEDFSSEEDWPYGFDVYGVKISEMTYEVGEVEEWLIVEKREIQRPEVEEPHKA